MKKLIVFLVTMVFSAGAFAQTDNITGKVSEANGDPVIGAVVYYEGTNTSAITNARGEYSIKALPGKDLTFSCIGMKNEVVTVGMDRKVNVTLKTDATVLEDAVVIGYGTQQRQDLTGSIASVKADEIRKAGQSNILGSLQGRVAGLNITSQSGEPGSGFNIQIRGNNSINAATTPLVVIDGMQMDINTDEAAGSSLAGGSSSDPLAFLNPVDIASVEVLKDASATAIYGARGANGVILITTKSGASNAGKTSVTFDANFGITTRALEREVQMLDGQEWINYRFERGDQNAEWFGKSSTGNTDPSTFDIPKTLEDYGRGEINWRDVLLRNGFTQNYNVTMRAKVGKGTNVLSSLGYMHQNGMIVNNSYQKFTGKVKVDHQVSKKLFTGVNVNYARMQSDGIAASTGGSFNNNGITQLLYLEKPVVLIDSPDTQDEYSITGTMLDDSITKESQRKGVMQRITANAYVNYHIIPSLTWRTSVSGNLSFSDNNEFYTPTSRWGRSKNGYGRYNNTSTNSWTANTTLTYKKNWQKAHNFEAMVGGEMNNYVYDYFMQSATNFEDYSLGYYALKNGLQQDLPSRSHYDNGRISAFGRINYNYKSRYYLTVNMRADASSRFSKDNRVGYFPSASFAWRVSNEKFMRRAKQLFLDNLKLRLSAGASGNDRISNYANLSQIGTIYHSDGLGNQLFGMAESQSGNPKLKWETTYQYDAGLDLTMFNGRINFVGDVYYKDTRDMLFKATTASQTGFAEQWQNIGRVSNKGIELALSTTNIKRRDFSWSTNLTFDLNRNKIISLGDGVEMMANNVSKGLFKEEPTRLIAGQPIGIIWGYVFDGNYQLDDFNISYDKDGKIPVDPSWVTSQNYDDFTYTVKDGVAVLAGANPKPGDRKFKDLDGDGKITEEGDKTVIGNCYPKFSYGIGNTLSWKGFDLYVFFDGVYGRDLLNEFKFRSTSGGNTQAFYNISRDAYYGAWRPENGSNYHARLKNSINYQQSTCSYFVEDASFVRLKTISLSYNLPSKVLKVLRMSGLKFSFNVDNIWTWTNYSGVDPDMSTTNSTFPGLDRMVYPKGRTYSLGVIANF